MERVQSTVHINYKRIRQDARCNSGGNAKIHSLVVDHEGNNKNVGGVLITWEQNGTSGQGKSVNETKTEIVSAVSQPNMWKKVLWSDKIQIPKVLWVEN